MREKLSAAVRTNRRRNSFCRWAAKNINRLNFLKKSHSTKNESFKPPLLFIHCRALQPALIRCWLSFRIFLNWCKSLPILKHCRIKTCFNVLRRLLINLQISEEYFILKPLQCPKPSRQPIRVEHYVTPENSGGGGRVGASFSDWGSAAEAIPFVITCRVLRPPPPPTLAWSAHLSPTDIWLND